MNKTVENRSDTRQECVLHCLNWIIEQHKKAAWSEEMGLLGVETAMLPNE